MTDAFTTFYQFQFIDGCFFGWVEGAHPTHEAVLRDGLYGSNFIETELIVHPRKGRSFHNPVTHTLAELEKRKPGVWFIAVVEKDEYRLMCERAQAQWAAEKARTRERIARTKRRPGPANLDDVPSRLRNRIRPVASGCWLWITHGRRRTRWGWRTYEEVRAGEYGRTKFAGRSEGAHRVMYRLLAGDIPDGAFLLHSCDTPACVNPDHLRPGIAEDNVRDWLARQFRAKINRSIAAKVEPNASEATR
jgi:hypothetical protein